MNEIIYLQELFLIYKGLLTPNEALNFEDYYINNLSLSEISENKKVSRSAISESIRSAKDKLLNLEKKLQVFKKDDAIRRVLKEPKKAEEILGGLDV